MCKGSLGGGQGWALFQSITVIFPAQALLLDRLGPSEHELKHVVILPDLCLEWDSGLPENLRVTSFG